MDWLQEALITGALVTVIVLLGTVFYPPRGR